MAINTKYIYALIFAALCTCMFFDYIVGFAIMVLALFIRIVLNNKSQVSFSGLDFFLFLYFALASISYLAQGFEIKNYLSMVVVPVWLYVLFSTTNPNHTSSKIVYWYLLILFVYSILLLFRDVSGNFTLSITDNAFINQRMVDKDQVTEVNRFFKNATLVSIWLVTFFVFSLCLFNTTKNKLFLVCIVVSLFFVVLSNTRTAIATCLVIVAFNYFFFNKVTVSRVLLFTLLPVALLLIAFITVSLIGADSGFQTERFTELFDDKSSHGLGQREYFWQFTILAIYKNLWGYGHSYVHDYLGYSTHNEYLGQAVSVGLLASISYYIFIITFFIKTLVRIKRNRNQDIKIWDQILLNMFIVYFIAGFTEQISFGNKLWMALLFMIMGIVKPLILQQEGEFRHQLTVQKA